MLTADDVLKIARLARLRLTDEEVQTFAAQLGHVVEYVDQLAALETEDVEPMAQAVEVTGVFRPDEPAESLPRAAALAAAPKADGECFLVPPVLGEVQ